MTTVGCFWGAYSKLYGVLKKHLGLACCEQWCFSGEGSFDINFWSELSHRMVEIGKAFWRSSAPLLKQVALESRCLLYSWVLFRNKDICYPQSYFLLLFEKFPCLTVFSGGQLNPPCRQHLPSSMTQAVVVTHLRCTTLWSAFLSV